MANRPLFTNAAALAGAAAVGRSIANPDADPDPIVGKVRLFDDSFVPDVGTTRAQLLDAETDLVGYPTGGYDLEQFDTPKFSPAGGAVITSNLIDVAYESGDAQVIGGYWVEDATDPDPQVREVFIYDPPITLAQVGDGFPIAVQLAYGANPS